MCIYFDKKNVTLRQKQKNGFSRQTDTTRTWRIQPRVWHHFRTKDVEVLHYSTYNQYFVRRSNMALQRKSVGLAQRKND